MPLDRRQKRLLFHTTYAMLRPSIRRGISMKRAVLYLRVSTTDQTTANQERELREVASRMAARSSTFTKTMASVALRAGMSGVSHCKCLHVEAYPINVINNVRHVSEVATIYCATSNPVQVIVAKAQIPAARSSVLSMVSHRVR